MQDSQSKPSRRGFFFGAVATGAAAAVVVALPGVSAPVALEAVEMELPKPVATACRTTSNATTRPRDFEFPLF